MVFSVLSPDPTYLLESLGSSMILTIWPQLQGGFNPCPLDWSGWLMSHGHYPSNQSFKSFVQPVLYSNFLWQRSTRWGLIFIKEIFLWGLNQNCPTNAENVHRFPKLADARPLNDHTNNLWLIISNSLKPVVRPSVRLSVRPSVKVTFWPEGP